MKDRLKKALLYGIGFLVFSPLMGFLILGVFTVLMMILSHVFGIGLIYFINSSVGYHFGGDGIGIDFGIQYVIGEGKLLYFLDKSANTVSLIDLLQVFLAILLFDYVIFGLPALLTGVVFGSCYHRPYSSLISGGVGALFSFIFAFFVACLADYFFGRSSFFAHSLQNILIALAFAALAFISGSLLAFLFKEKLVGTDGFKEPHKLIT